MKAAMNWNAALYDEKHHFVSTYGQDVLTLLEPAAGEKILDAGCGTGTLCHQLAGFGAEVKGVDLSVDMVERAKAAYPELDFEVADLTDFDLGETFDAIFSNATLHWVLPPEKAITCLLRHLSPGGRLVLEMGGRLNVEQIIQAIFAALKQRGHAVFSVENFWYFPSPGSYSTLLEQAGFEVQLVHYFERPTRLSGLDGMRNWIEMFGAYFFRDIDPKETEKVIGLAVEKLKPTHFKEESWWADYRRLRIKAIKPL